MRKKKNKEINKTLVELLEQYRKKNIKYYEALIDISEKINIDFEELIEVIPEEIINTIKNEMKKQKFIKDKKSPEDILKDKLKKMKEDL